MTTTPVGAVVVVDGNLHPSHDFGLERRRWAAAGITVRLASCRTEDDIIQAATDADVIAFWGLDVPVTRRVINKLPRCRAVVRYGTGVDSIDIAAATEAGVVVASPVAYSTREVAEHTCALLLALARQLGTFDKILRSAGWRHPSSTTKLHRLAEATLGLVGFGRIAQQVARNMTPMVRGIIAADPYGNRATAQQLGVTLVPLNKLLTTSDLISIHLPLAPETIRLIGAAEIAMMKSTAVLVNTSRGAVVDEQAMATALGRQALAGAGLDVFELEPLPVDSPLRGLENVILTPHAAGASEEAKADLYLGVCKIVEDIFQDRWPAGVTNPEVIPVRPLLT